MTRLPLDLATLQDEWQSGTTETTETTVTGFGGEGGGAQFGDLAAAEFGSSPR